MKINRLFKAIEQAKSRSPDEGRIQKAVEALRKYKAGKVNLEQRIIDDEEFYQLRYRRTTKGQKTGEMKESTAKPTTAWLLNSVVNKHADLMDSFPEADCLPRESQDEEDAKVLSEILPVILSHNGYEETYSDAAWYFLKHGVSCQGVFWDPQKENGLGDITVSNVDILNLFWEPGIKDIQESRNLFYVSLVDDDIIDRMIGERKSRGSDINVADYIYDDSIDKTDKSVVVDWYYKKQTDDGRTVLHYMKFTGDTVIFASEDDPRYENGFYEHGKYPFVISKMYPEAGTPTGFGIIAICRDPQQYIDILDGLILDYVAKITKPRWWAKKTAGVNKRAYLNWDEPIVEVEGDIDEEKLRQITVQNLDSNIYNIRQMKVDELKETSSNRDFSQGSTAAGVTSGAAIATLQEAGNKTSRDILKNMYRGYVEVVCLVIELIRQFYDERREFRILGADGAMRFVEFSNANIKEKADGEYSRKPIFDIDVRAEKSNPYAKMSQNETAANLYNMGMFNPQNAQQALLCLEIMEFEGKEKIKEKVQEGETLYNIVQMQQEQIAKLSAIAESLTGGMGQIPPEEAPAQGSAPPGGQQGSFGGGNPVGEAFEGAADAHLNTYGKKLVERARV